MCHESGGTEACSVVHKMRNGLSSDEDDVNVHFLIESRALSAKHGSKTVRCPAYIFTGVTSLCDVFQLLERFCCLGFLSCLLLQVI